MEVFLTRETHWSYFVFNSIRSMWYLLNVVLEIILRMTEAHIMHILWLSNFILTFTNKIHPLGVSLPISWAGYSWHHHPSQKEQLQPFKNKTWLRETTERTQVWGWSTPCPIETDFIIKVREATTTLPIP